MCFLSLFVMLYRIIVFMDCHPRIAMISRTISTAVDDLVHFVLIFGILFYFFAYAAHFMFGTEFEDFATTRGASYAQFRMIVGDFPFPGHSSDRDVLFFI